MTPRAFGEKLAESFGQTASTNIKGYRGRIAGLAGPDAMSRANDKLVSPKPAQPATQTTPAQPPKPAPAGSSWWPWASAGASAAGAVR